MVNSLDMDYMSAPFRHLTWPSVIRPDPNIRHHAVSFRHMMPVGLLPKLNICHLTVSFRHMMSVGSLPEPAGICHLAVSVSLEESLNIGRRGRGRRSRAALLARYYGPAPAKAEPARHRAALIATGADSRAAAARGPPPPPAC